MRRLPQNKNEQKKGGDMSTIALVDDDRNILTSVSITLESEGYDVTTYNDGQAALDGFNQKLPDIAVLEHKNAAHGRHGIFCTASGRNRICR